VENVSLEFDFPLLLGDVGELSLANTEKTAM